MEAQDEGTLRTLRVRTQTGHPLASDRFMSEVEAFLRRRVAPASRCFAGKDSVITWRLVRERG